MSTGPDSLTSLPGRLTDLKPGSRVEQVDAFGRPIGSGSGSTTGTGSYPGYTTSTGSGPSGYGQSGGATGPGGRTGGPVSGPGSSYTNGELTFRQSDVTLTL